MTHESSTELADALSEAQAALVGQMRRGMGLPPHVHTWASARDCNHRHIATTPPYAITQDATIARIGDVLGAMPQGISVMICPHCGRIIVQWVTDDGRHRMLWIAGAGEDVGPSRSRQA